MTERKGGLSPQAREFVAVGASIGAGCHPCVTHHLKAGAEAGLGAQELEAAITAAERVIADSSARMAQHARRQLPAPAGSAGADGPAVAVALAALGAAVAANSMPNIERYLTEAAQLDVSGGELTDAVNVAHEVQRNAARIHAQRTGEPGRRASARRAARATTTTAASAPARRRPRTGYQLARQRRRLGDAPTRPLRRTNRPRPPPASRRRRLPARTMRRERPWAGARQRRRCFPPAVPA